MAGFCGVHFRKLKTASHIIKACSHDRRNHVPKNVNKDRVSQNVALLDHGQDRWEYTNEQIAKRVKRKVQHNAVRLIEAFVYSSPEYFRPGNPGKKGTWDGERLKPWVGNVHRWLLSEYSKENVVEVHLHLDEATPHVHACILPITEDGRLNAKDFLMSRAGLRTAQTNLAKVLKPLGLKRGLKGSGAKHIPADKWAIEIQNCLNTFTKVPRPAPVGKSPVITAKKYKKLEGDYRSVAKALRKAEKRATHIQTVELENKQLKQRNSAYALELELLRPYAKQLRGIEIQEIIENYDQSKILSLDEKGRAQSKNDSKWRGRNAIDVVMHLNECDYKEAVLWLYKRFGLNEVTSCVLDADRVNTRNEIVKLHNQALAEQKQQSLKKYDQNWHDRATNQRAYYILYDRNVKKEVIDDFSVWENENGRFLKNTGRDYHIWDKGDRLILRKAETADLNKAVKLMLEIAVDKGWELNECVASAFGSKEFKDEVKSQVADRVMNRKINKKSPRSKL